jgi:16S rRNA (guanine1207-N2)-methyltransferase
MALSSPFDTLLIPFQHGLLKPDTRMLIIGARYHEDLPVADLWQIFKPFVDELSPRKDSLISEISEEQYDAVFCLVPKQVEEAKYWIAQGLNALHDGGMIFIAAANDANGNRLAGWMKEAGIENINSESKNKAKVVWGIKNAPAPKSWINGGAQRLHDFGHGYKFYTQPGLFSWDRLDKASTLLIDHVKDLKGDVADFGAGYGYLTYAALKKFPAIKSITMIEADKRALDCASKNLEGKNAVPYWHDAMKALPPAKMFDHIIMNPPFHTGKKTDSDLGQGFIKTAVTNLKKGGSLTLVANTHLPYEEILKTTCTSVVTVIVKDGFKVIKAIK